jgi:hypothetical protein
MFKSVLFQPHTLAGLLWLAGASLGLAQSTTRRTKLRSSAPPMVLGTQGAGIRAHLSRYHRRTSCAHAEQSDQWYFGLCLSEPRYPIPPGHLYPANNPRSWHTLDVRLDNLGIELFAGYNTSLSNGVISGDSFGPVTLTFTPAAVPEPSTASLVAGRTWKAESVPILLTCPLFIASVRREAPSGRQGLSPFHWKARA